MERLIDVFCHAIRITDPLSIKIAVGIVGGGLPLIFLIAVLIRLSELAASLRENATPVSHQLDHRKRRVGGRSASKKPTISQTGA